MSSVAVVTGGTGFIGSHLVNRLLRDGVRVRVLVRDRKLEAGSRKRGTPGQYRSHFPFPTARGGAEVVWGDLTDRSAVSDALRGADIVYHLAGCARAWMRDASRFHAVNGVGTQKLCRAASEHAVRRLVHVSTELVAGGANRHDARVRLTAYQRSKLEGERAVQDYLDKGGDAVILRPTRVYGPGILSQSNSVTRLIDLYRRGLFRFRIADGDVQANYVYVDDVVEGILLAAGDGGGGAVGTRAAGAAGAAAGAVYTLGGENATLTEFLAAIIQATGTERTVFALPKAMAKFFGAAAELMGYLGLDPLITRDWTELLTCNWPASSDRARDELGYEARGIAQGIRETVNWLEAGCPSPFPAPQQNA